jgi:2-polyprenyl-3-methyl-5-hydroxy-6-metoxy-1,4-benzoquinol methylase
MSHQPEATETRYFKTVPCPLCGSSKWKRRYPIDTLYAESVSGIPISEPKPGVASCLSCGHLFIQPSPTSEFLKSFYSSYMSRAKDGFYRDRHQDQIPASFRERYDPWLSRIAAVTGKGAALLDIGTGLGMFLRLARENGFRVEGVEPNAEAAKRLEASFGISVHNCLVEELNTRAQYDVATMWDLLEHLAEPGPAVRKVRDVLRPGGLLVIEQPVRDSFIHFLAKAVYKVSFGRIPRPLYLVYGIHHLQYFSEASMKRFLADNGFEVLEAYRDETSAQSLDRRPESTFSNRAAVMAYKAGMRLCFLMARLSGKQNKLILIARKKDA